MRGARFGSLPASMVKSASATHASSLAAEAAGRAGEVCYNRYL